MSNIKTIKDNLLTQDNRATSDPIFAVQQRKRIYGMSPDYSDYYFWMNDDGERADEEIVKELDRAGEYSEIASEGRWERVYYQDHWEFVTACFTEQGCQDYIDRNAHNLAPTRIYTYSAYRNEEWRTIRKMLMDDEV